MSDRHLSAAQPGQIPKRVACMMTPMPPMADIVAHQNWAKAKGSKCRKCDVIYESAEVAFECMREGGTYENGMDSAARWIRIEEGKINADEGKSRRAHLRRL